jgi:hypothetical protein
VFLIAWCQRDRNQLVVPHHWCGVGQVRVRLQVHNRLFERRSSDESLQRSDGFPHRDHQELRAFDLTPS